jgi:hypothetical protein
LTADALRYQPFFVRDLDECIEGHRVIRDLAEQLFGLVGADGDERRPGLRVIVSRQTVGRARRSNTLDRGGSPDAHFPDRDGEYWALCPFHPDKHPENFSVSEAGYHCFACDASGGLWALADKLGIARLRGCTVVPGD